MNRFIFIIFFSLPFLKAADLFDDPILHHQKYLSRMGSFSKTCISSLLKEVRKREMGISQEDYRFLKGTSGFAASGAEWAHKIGALGEGTEILLLENSGINHADMKKVVERGYSENPTFDYESIIHHGSSMVSLIHSIAPKAKIHVVPTDEVDVSFMDIRIINASFGSNQLKGFARHFKNIRAGNNILIVKSSGNEHQDLSIHPYTKDCDRLLPFTIFAGNLRQDYKTNARSGFPGKNPKIQQSFLWLVSDNILTATGPDESTQYSPTSGTSNAAAILSGAAALFPLFKADQLKEILLESADRDIFQEFDSGYRVIHIPDPMLTYYRQRSQVEKGFDSLDALQKEYSPIIAYDKELWGKGILNIRNALLYAELKKAFPNKKAADLRECMIKLLNRKQQGKAVLIQRVFRKHRENLEKLIPSFDTPLRITLNISAKSRDFIIVEPIRKNLYTSNFNQEEIDKKILKKYGIMLPKAPCSLKIINTFQIADHRWKQCFSPMHASEKLATFIESPLHETEKTFNTFFLDEILPLLRKKPAYAANVVFKKYKELLSPFSANKVVTLGQNWMESETCFINKVFHAKTTIIGLIHDGIRNRDIVEKSYLVEFAMHLYKKIEEEGLLTERIQSTILALLKDNKEERDETVCSFILEQNLLSHPFNTFVIKNNHEADMLELYAYRFEGIDLFSEQEKQEFRL